MNPRDPFIATRLAAIHELAGDIDRGLSCLSEALDSNRGDQKLNYSYAQLLRRNKKAEASLLIYHYRRAFSKWDSNLDAQFWYARYAFEHGGGEERDLVREVFRHLRQSRMSRERKTEVREVSTENGKPKVFTGVIKRLEATYGFVAVDGRADWIFMHSSNIEDSVWNGLRVGGRTAFLVGFTMSGPRALEIQQLV